MVCQITFCAVWDYLGRQEGDEEAPPGQLSMLEGSVPEQWNASEYINFPLYRYICCEKKCIGMWFLPRPVSPAGRLARTRPTPTLGPSLARAGATVTSRPADARSRRSSSVRIRFFKNTLWFAVNLAKNAYFFQKFAAVRGRRHEELQDHVQGQCHDTGGKKLIIKN